MYDGPSRTQRYRRTRFVCVSDTHNQTPKLPRGDVLIHAGDLTNQGSLSELSKTVKWLERADFEAKIVVAGNHDVTLDKQFYNEHGSYFHKQTPQSPDECLDLLRSSPSITYLNHSSATVQLTRSPALPVSFSVFGSPYSPRSGMWAFGYDKTTCAEQAAGDDLWSAIPLDTDLVITHTPPWGHCDESTSRRRAMGCEDLRRALWRVRPKLAVCGHVHEGRGVQRVRWDVLGTSAAPYAELGSDRWEDPGAALLHGSKKLSLVDLTARGGWKRPLDNDGSPLRRGAPAERHPQDGFCKHLVDGSVTTLPGFGTRGIGGNPEVSVRCDRNALCCRLGRKETCVINCAIAATNWPHEGGKRFNKPIVVDLDLPVMQD
ncbi:Metallo-dependent phosphatase [Cryphonectria parasitica EP155]|uniref:Metallo-dependent phosphatase n=1 Tax=Cryphonectria parasitica (strain ATCC 38755 / EP155) TaxID=660469 RepID=A0A9P5CU11_CRYP1|nr:Metallo-dependent phosphatase [Cryphonectria parasitica EP155]KAF3771199.1 Metallo-dependent phosphatase [Cryphonectria parasitica EP155]